MPVRGQDEQASTFHHRDGNADHLSDAIRPFAFGHNRRCEMGRERIMKKDAAFFGLLEVNMTLVTLFFDRGVDRSRGE